MSLTAIVKDIHFKLNHCWEISAIVEVKDITYNEGIVENHLGKVLEHVSAPT